MSRSDSTESDQPWLSFALFTLDYVIKVTASRTAQLNDALDSSSLFTFRKQFHIQHGMSRFLPPYSLVVVLDTCVSSKGVPALFRWLSKKYPKISAFSTSRCLF